MKKILVHGGAGALHGPEAEVEATLRAACEQGMEPLLGGVTEAAVERAVNVMEDCEHLNAGRGAVIQLDGDIRLDAAIMNSDLSCGAVAHMPDIKHAISIARLVMRKTAHVLLAGQAAAEFALQLGFTVEELRTRRRVAEWLELTDRLAGLSYPERLEYLKNGVGAHHGTVGAVAFADGRLTAGTSTGGRGSGLMLEGRVGDTPIIGSGTYCNRFAAVSATGFGEEIMRVVLAKHITDLVERGATAQQAADEGLAMFERQTGSEAGVIVLDHQGGHGIAFNTAQMPHVLLES